MKILRLGQEPHVEVEYEAIEIAPNEYITWDHLHGFDANYRSPTLDMFDSGVVHTEYIFPEQVKKQYPDLDLRFDATMMIHNNHFDSYQYHIKSVPPKITANFVSTFNKSRSDTKQNFLLICYANGWTNSEYCSKFFAISLGYAENFFASINRPPPLGLDDFCQTTWQFEMSGYGNAKFDLSTLGPKIQQSFIHIVTETIGNSAVPFPTEKLLLPIANQTLWIGYAPAGYHNYVEQNLGFKPYRYIDYDFDSVVDPVQRLLAIEQVLLELSNMTQQEQRALYDANQDIIEYNYQLIKSGEFIQNLKKHDQASYTIRAYRQRMLQNKRYRNYMDIT